MEHILEFLTFKQTLLENNKINKIYKWLFKNIIPDIKIKKYMDGCIIEDGAIFIGHNYFIGVDIPNTNDIKKFLENFQENNDKEEILKTIIEISNYSISDPDSIINCKNSYFYFPTRFFFDIKTLDGVAIKNIVNGDQILRIFLASKTSNSRMTLDNLLIIDPKPNKSFLRSVINALDLKGSSMNLINDLFIKDRVEFFRILGDSSGIQFSKQQLKDIIALPGFSKVTKTGVFSNSETQDIINRRTILIHQNNADAEIFFNLNDQIKNAPKESQVAFYKTIKKPSIKEKFSKYEEVKLWYEMN